MKAYIVFEKNGPVLKQISRELENEESAKSFVETMKDGKYYKTIHPEIELLYCQVKIDLEGIDWDKKRY